VGGRAQGPQSVIRARLGGAGPQGSGGRDSKPEKGSFIRGSSGGFHGLILASFALRQMPGLASSDGGESSEPIGQSRAATRPISVELR
jgi:hypothetical protein